MAVKQAGQIALMPFPFTNLSQNKRRPVLLLRKLYSNRDDWLVCMVSSQLHQWHAGLDWVIRESDREFPETGLKAPSLFRVSRLAVIDGGLLVGQLGVVTDQRLHELRNRLANWVIHGDSSD